jgi:hypothetical protein
VQRAKHAEGLLRHNSVVCQRSTVYVCYQQHDVCISRCAPNLTVVYNCNLVFLLIRYQRWPPQGVITVFCIASWSLYAGFNIPGVSENTNWYPSREYSFKEVPS